MYTSLSGYYTLREIIILIIQWLKICVKISKLGWSNEIFCRKIVSHETKLLYNTIHHESYTIFIICWHCYTYVRLLYTLRGIYVKDI